MTRVLCAGDRFITAESVAEAARLALGQGTEIVAYQAGWPDVPFGEVDGGVKRPGTRTGWRSWART